jgi:ABC-type lipoprotein release transport system permease subunit
LVLGVLGEGGRIGAVGLAVGMVLAYAAMQAVDAALEGAAPWRGSAVMVVVAVLLLAALASSAWPAWRALRVPASEVLRG